MKVLNFNSDELLHFESLISDFLAQKPDISDLVSSFPSFENCQTDASSKEFSPENRSLLCKVIARQYDGLSITSEVQKNIDALASNKTFTITTGHQLCLFTGPLYFIYKIISVIKLCQQLNEIGDNKFVPVFWLASEDHDFEEVNHAFFYQKKIVWEQNASGPVGPIRTDSILTLIDDLKSIMGSGFAEKKWLPLLTEAYSQPTLADATRFLANELFGRFGLVVIDANNREFKSLFIDKMKDELLESPTMKAVSITNKRLLAANYKVHVNPREINLFYMSSGIRARIEKKSEDSWHVVGHPISWTKEELMEELNSAPERFSPNVIMRPVYQETILPNIAYIGGPSEIAYWLQLKGLFDFHKLKFPLLVLRDSALLINQKQTQKIEKLGLKYNGLFGNREVLRKSVINIADASLNTEQEKIAVIFQSVISKMSSVDATLENTARADEQRISQMLSNLEKKMIKALKTKEEVKVQQIDKLMDELFPEGILQERHDNFFQYVFEFGDELLDYLMANFAPLKNEFHILTKNQPE